MVEMNIFAKHKQRRRHREEMYGHQGEKRKVGWNGRQTLTVKATVFLAVVYRCGSWIIKKAECWWIDAFEPSCWRRLLRVTWIARRWNCSILKEINPEYSLEGLMLNLKLQYFGHVTWKTWLLEKTWMMGKIEGRRRRGWQRMRWLDGITGTWVWVSSRN